MLRLMASHSIEHPTLEEEVARGHILSAFSLFTTRERGESEERPTDDGLVAFRELAFVLLCESILGSIAIVFFVWCFFLGSR